MRFDQRVIFNTTDISEKVNDYRTGTQLFNYTAGQYLYVGSALPFNHLFFEMSVGNYINVYEVQTLTFPTLIGATASDYIVIYDKTGGAWAVALDTTGADPDPTGALWTSIPGANKIKVNISGATTAAQVATLAFAGLISLTGFSAVITLVDNANGTLTSTQTAYGATTNPIPHNADDSGAGSITGVEVTAGSAGATPTIEYWWGNAWETAVDVQDNTVGLSETGSLQFSTYIDHGWDWEQRASDVTGLSAFQIYNMFWLRISWNNTFKPTAAINYIGQKFSNDQILYSYFPDLSLTEVLESFGAGKTTWNEQHYMAAEHIVKDLIKRQIIVSRSQILDPFLFKDASCYKVAEIVYRGLGKAYFDQMQDAADRYSKEMNMKFYRIDQNQNARLEPQERTSPTGFFTR